MITITPSALNQIRKLISSREMKPLGIRLGIDTKGCSGLSYNLQYVDELIEGDELMKIEDVNLYVDPKATLFLIGTQMDYEEGELESGFKFLNPNEKGRCGCGESFHV
ncbi:MAG: Fe-S cluster assembly scaffold SufA [Rickettsiales bacterium]|nr:Fe-S cluster assembly scaffold SufA [Rickettsiales bacterium]|tara:strand:+ start:787 stop:1110 length:324 start_codon:yes stop_codon:yes gene_type:complete